MCKLLFNLFIKQILSTDYVPQPCQEMGFSIKKLTTPDIQIYCV